jgi:hypothetical protein
MVRGLLKTMVDFCSKFEIVLLARVTEDPLSEWRVFEIEQAIATRRVKSGMTE